MLLSRTIFRGPRPAAIFSIKKPAPESFQKCLNTFCRAGYFPASNERRTPKEIELTTISLLQTLLIFQGLQVESLERVVSILISIFQGLQVAVLSTIMNLESLERIVSILLSIFQGL